MAISWGKGAGKWGTWGQPAPALLPGARKLSPTPAAPAQDPGGFFGDPSAAYNSGGDPSLSHFFGSRTATKMGADINARQALSPGDSRTLGGQGQFSTPGQAPAYSPTDLLAPGTGEKWWTDHQNEVNAPPKMDEFLKGATGRLLGMNYAPDNASGAYGQMKNELGAPTAGTKNAWGVSQQLRDPTAGEGLQSKAAGMLGGNNLAHDYATEMGGWLKGPGAAENNLAVTDKALGGINFGQQGIDATGKLTGNAGAFFGDNLKHIGDFNTVGNESNNFLPGLRDRSDSEKLYDSGGGNGLDFAYQRATDKSMRALQTKMAATGMFGSGVNARGMEEIYADSAANQARDQASLAAQADQARLGRTGAALSFSDAAGKESLARLGLSMSGAATADESARGNVNTILGATKNASDEALGKVGARTTAASSAEQQMIARLLGGSNIAAAGDKSMVDQATALGGIGHNLAGDETNRLETSSRTGLAADDQRRAQLDTLMKGSASLDDLVQKAAQIGITREQVLGTLTANADTQDWQRTTDRQSMANDVQHLFEGRNQTQFQDLFQTGAAKANLVGSSTGAATDEQGQLVKSQLDNMVAAGTLTKQQADQLLGQGIEVASLFVQAASGGKK